MPLWNEPDSVEELPIKLRLQSAWNLLRHSRFPLHKRYEYVWEILEATRKKNKWVVHVASVAPNLEEEEFVHEPPNQKCTKCGMKLVSPDRFTMLSGMRSHMFRDAWGILWWREGTTVAVCGGIEVQLDPARPPGVYFEDERPCV